MQFRRVLKDIGRVREVKEIHDDQNIIEGCAESKDRLRIALAQSNIPGHSPDLAPSDFHLFSILKEFFGWPTLQKR